MKKPNGYDEALEVGAYTPVELGGHFAVIKQVSERQTRTNKPMIVVVFDFHETDAQPAYFTKSFEADTRPEKKWPFPGTKYIMVYDYKDPNKTSRQFKTFCSCFEKSNNVTITWDGADWGRQFREKRIGVVYGEEENQFDGETSMRRIPKYFCQWNSVKDAAVPAPKYINSTGPAPAATPVEGFTPVDFDEIPF